MRSGRRVGWPTWFLELHHSGGTSRAERGIEFNDEVKRKILGLNAAARLYGIDIAAQKAKLAGEPVAVAAE